jgi:cell division protein FtsB
MRTTKRRPLKDYLIAGALIILLTYLLINVLDIYRKEEIARETARESKQELEDLQVRRNTLESNLASLETKRGQEESYREQFGVALPGEEVIIVVAEEEEEPQTGLSWWRKLLGFFGL